MNLKSSLSLQSASTIVDTALSNGRAEGMLPLTVVVLDSGGRIVATKSEDGSGLLRFDIAYGKAWGALGMGISSRLIGERLGARPSFQNALAAASDGKVIPVPGGVLIKDEDSSVVGAVGISGDTSDKDEYCAILGIRKADYESEPKEPNAEWQNSKLSDLDR